MECALGIPVRIFERRTVKNSCRVEHRNVGDRIGFESSPIIEAKPGRQLRDLVYRTLEG